MRPIEQPIAMKLLPRRQFIRNSALAVGASALAGPFIRSVRAGEPGPNDKIRLGLIGSGGMGRGDLECFFGNPEVDCVVIADVDEAMTAKGLEVCATAGRKKPDDGKGFSPRAGSEGRGYRPHRHAGSLACDPDGDGVSGGQGCLCGEAAGQDD